MVQTVSFGGESAQECGRQRPKTLSSDAVELEQSPPGGLLVSVGKVTSAVVRGFVVGLLLLPTEVPRGQRVGTGYGIWTGLPEQLPTTNGGGQGAPGESE